MSDPVAPDLTAIRARAEAATPGPWTTWVDGHNNHSGVCTDDGEVGISDDVEGADAEFIAHARTDVPALLDALEAAQSRIDKAKAAIDEHWWPLSNRIGTGDALMLSEARIDAVRRILTGGTE